MVTTWSPSVLVLLVNWCSWSAATLAATAAAAGSWLRAEIQRSVEILHRARRERRGEGALCGEFRGEGSPDRVVKGARVDDLGIGLGKARCAFEGIEGVPRARDGLLNADESRGLVGLRLSGSDVPGGTDEDGRQHEDQHFVAPEGPIYVCCRHGLAETSFWDISVPSASPARSARRRPSQPDDSTLLLRICTLARVLRSSDDGLGFTKTSRFTFPSVVFLASVPYDPLKLRPFVWARVVTFRGQNCPNGLIYSGPHGRRA